MASFRGPATTLALVLASVPVRGRLTWTQVPGFIPDEMGDLEHGHFTLDGARLWCAQRAECGGFTFSRNDVNRPPGSVMHVWFKRPSEWFSDEGWASNVKQLTPCTTTFVRTHRSGLLCCEGDCPSTHEQGLQMECELYARVERGVLPLCASLDAPLARRPPADALARASAPSRPARSAAGARVIDLARVGLASMSSVYTDGSPVWLDARAAIDADDETMMHTQCAAGEWWRVDLVHTAEVHQVVVLNRAEFQFRLQGVEVQLLAENGSALAAQPLQRAGDRSVLVFDPPVREVQRVALLAPAERKSCVHVRTVQVLGRVHPHDGPRAHVEELFGLARASLRAEPVLPRGRPGPETRAGAGEMATERDPRTWWVALLCTTLLLGLQSRHVYHWLAAQMW